MEASFPVAGMIEVKGEEHSNSRLCWGGGSGTAIAAVLQEVRVC